METDGTGVVMNKKCIKAKCPLVIRKGKKGGIIMETCLSILVVFAVLAAMYVLKFDRS